MCQILWYVQKKFKYAEFYVDDEAYASRFSTILYQTGKRTGISRLVRVQLGRKEHIESQ